MVAVQLMCARVGEVTDRGLASVLRKHYPAWVLWVACGLLTVANTVNIGADLGAMAAGGHLITGVRSIWFLPPFAIAMLLVVSFTSYAQVSAIFKWLTLSLFAYVGAAFLARPDWGTVLLRTVVPHVQQSHDYVLTVVAILGTTISPYLFFWQAASSAEERDAPEATIGDRAPRAVERELRTVRADVMVGMFFSNLIMYFIILTAGATLHGVQANIETAEQAAAALRPLAGPAAEFLFAAGLIGTGLLGVPVLAGSAAYALAEAGAWRRGMDKTPRTAGRFYAVFAVALLIGTVIDLLGINPIRLLFWSAVINGLLAPPLIVIILIVCNNATIMGPHRNGRAMNVVGILAAVIMTVAAVALVASWVV
jgi:Mn2+/Fe2+ NRAMP family transporter